MAWIYALMRKAALYFLLTVMLAAGLPLNVYAEGGSVDTSIAATAGNVVTVENLASALRNHNKNSNSAKTNGGFSWDTEGKTRSWTYYNGIMMDAFLMLNISEYESYVDAFYNANIGTQQIFKMV